MLIDNIITNNIVFLHDIDDSLFKCIKTKNYKLS